MYCWRLYWEWRIEEGEMWQIDARPHLAGTGYSGSGEGKNNPALTRVRDVGPIPVGAYTIDSPRDTPLHGPYVLPLIPSATNEMYGRSGFLIHGDSIEHPGTASQGCIILPRSIRESIGQSGAHELQVRSSGWRG